MNYHIFTIASYLLTILLLLLPILLGWSFDDLSYGMDNMPILESLRSRDFRDALVSSVAISTILLIDLMFEGFSSKKSRVFYLLRISLLSVTSVPDIIILLWVSNSGSPKFLIVLFQLRVVSIHFLGLLILYHADVSAFRVLVIPAIVIDISSVLREYLSFTCCANNAVYIGFYFFMCSSTLLLSRANIICYRSISKLPCQDSGSKILIARVFLNSFLVANISNLAVLSVFGPAINGGSPSIYLCVQTYSFLIFSISSWLRFGRITRAEAAQTMISLHMKRIFVRYVSHEIRTPLNTVLMGLQVLKRESIQSNNMKYQVETIEEIETSCEAAIIILNDLLDYEKLDSGIMKLEKASIQIDKFLQDAVRPFQIQSRQAEVSLELLNIDTLENCYFIDGDKHKLVQIIRNFISNALKFTPSRGRVTVEANIYPPEIKSQSGVKNINSQRYNNVPTGDTSHISRVGKLDPSVPFVRIQVRDTGCGIDPCNLHKVFNEIVQFNAGELQNGGGSGLGLWISRSIAEMHRGSVFVYSAGIGHGCVFALELPIVQNIRSVLAVPSEVEFHVIPNSVSNHDTHDRINSNHNHNNIDILNFHNLSILVVDDAKMNRKMQIRLLQSRFKYVIEAEDGQVAVDLIQKSMAENEDTPNVILMDYVMPVKDGPTATRELRSIGYSGIIIGVTGNALPSDIDFFMKHGANEVLIKPLRLEVLENIILKFNNVFES